MKAIILAAGSGRRMQPLTHATHKTLLTVGDRPLIGWIVDALLARNIDDIAIVTGFQRAAVTAYLAETYPHLPIAYVHNERYAQTNNIFSLALALEQLEFTGDVLLFECDLIFEPAALDRLLAAPHANVALVDHHARGMDGTVLEVEQGIVTQVIPPHRQGANFDFSDKYKTLNIYRFSQDFCTGDLRKLLAFYAHAIDDNCYYELILGVLIFMQRQTIHAAILDGERWAEIDDPNDLDAARFLFAPANRRQILDEAHGGFWRRDVQDFCYLRNMYFPTPAMLRELRNSLPELLHNYGSSQQIVNRKLAYFLNCGEGHLLALNGASQAYPILGDLFRRQRVLRPAPTFGEYARIFPHADLYPDQVGIDPTQVERRAETSELVVLVNPNNPTGTLLPTDWIYQFAARHRKTAVLVDESFIDFSDQASLLPLLEQEPLPNVILIKSLSKSLGVPGMRLGFLYTSDAARLAQVQAALPIWNLNSIAEHFLELILKHRPALASSYRQTQRDRALFAHQLAQAPLIEEVFPSGGNFLLLALACSQKTLNKLVETMLQQHKLYLKAVSDRFPGERAYLRLAVRLPGENAQLAEILAQQGATR